MSEKIKVYTQFDRPKRVFTNPGTRFLDTFQEQIAKDGSIEVVKVGQRCVYDEIQVDLESTKIENILHAVALGDLNALKQREAFYVDATTMPKNLMEAQNIVVRAKEEFYVSEMGTKEFLDKLSPYNDKLAAIKKAGDLKTYNEKVAAEAKFQKDVEAVKGVTE